MQAGNIQGESESGAPTAVQIQEALTQIYDIIDRVGQHLEKTFQNQEDRFLEDYRKQMYSAQKNLREYTKTHSQAELTKKIEEKERTLRFEREKALNATLNSSDRLKNLKKNAANLKQTLETLEDEIRFIDDQTVLSEEKNRRLNEEAKFLKLEILKRKPEFEFWEEDPQGGDSSDMRKDSSSNRKATYNSQLLNSLDGRGKISKSVGRKKPTAWKDSGYRSADEANEQEIERLTKLCEFEKRNFDLLVRLSEDRAFQKGKFEEIFDDCIKKSLDRNTDRVENPYANPIKLPILSPNGEAPHVETEDISQTDTANTEKIKLAEMNITAQDKKVMIEEFLANKEVKEYFYGKFVEDTSKKGARHLL